MWSGQRRARPGPDLVHLFHMNPDLLALPERYERQIVALQAQVADLQAQLTARDARIADLEAQLAAAQRAAKRQATPFARRLTAASVGLHFALNMY